ncbi:voltage-dependent calcium channel subunit alpha-2/delta-4 isoform X2 [Selaginella moellendorffii]|uniref:voltage-dependent calcium channel subunit alpha-2/delta-4 isoform X2 n=1 Tax=Selaginella moellendorffii TaxID=88036 RepID=UPI000D1D02AE|nr:voltage-dependent calcium channel subunit alpha-2/delta-4 isoform X2 [Selaginella moellendorffii]|eukprot:XP_024544949.1 voltage-dependent calcium channel subunit alpha-2/delta-4 isoform X2 [Selaginella moellendorffii]
MVLSRLVFVALWYLHAHSLDDIEAVLDEAAFQVQEIARQAISNRENACGSLSQCTIENCSRHTCRPQSRDEIQSLSCVNVGHNLDCSTPTNGTCQNLSVSSKRSYIRLSPSALESDTDVKIAMCAQKSLDRKLQLAWKSTSKVSHGWVFFGGAEGYLYIYPGRDYTDDHQCKLYDPRKRPWYVHALAVVKSLYIVLDTSSSMSISIGPLSSQSRLAVAKGILDELLDTLTNGDQVIVSDMNGGKPFGGKPVSVSLEGLETSFDHAGISALKNAISNARADKLQTDIKKAFVGALDFFNSSSNLNVILLLTDGQFANHVNLTDLDPIFKQLNEKNVVVFVYRIGFYISNDETFQRMQFSLNISFEAVKDETNPLMKIRSYLDYLAWLRFSSVNRKPVWVPLYADSGGRNVTSSILPAFDATQRLIGVACIDIVTDDLINSLGLAVVQEAVSKRSPGPSLEQKPLTLKSSHPVLEATTGCDFAGSLTPICPRQEFSTPMADFICCGANCSSSNVTATSSLGKHYRIGETIGIIVGSMAALAVALAGIYYACWRTKPCPDPTQGLEEQNGDDWVIPSRRIKARSGRGATTS